MQRGTGVILPRKIFLDFASISQRYAAPIPRMRSIFWTFMDFTLMNSSFIQESKRRMEEKWENVRLRVCLRTLLFLF